MLFGEHHSSLSLSARQSSRVLCGGCSPPAPSRKREGKTKEKNSFTLCAASTYDLKRRCLFQAWQDFSVAAHGVLQLSFGAGAQQPGRAWCGHTVSAVGTARTPSGTQLCRCGHSTASAVAPIGACRFSSAACSGKMTVCQIVGSSNLSWREDPNEAISPRQSNSPQTKNISLPATGNLWSPTDLVL